MEADASRIVPDHLLPTRIKNQDNNAQQTLNQQTLCTFDKYQPVVDIVVGLHCCGGLSEVALNVAAASHASFLVCTCCFCSHPQLALLTKPLLPSLPFVSTVSNDDALDTRTSSSLCLSLTDNGNGVDILAHTTTNGATKHDKFCHSNLEISQHSQYDDVVVDDIAPEIIELNNIPLHIQRLSADEIWYTVTRLAESDDAGDIHVRSQAVINSMRLLQTTSLYKQSGYDQHLSLKQLRFPSVYSKRNIVLMGSVE